MVHVIGWWTRHSFSSFPYPTAFVFLHRVFAVSAGTCRALVPRCAGTFFIGRRSNACINDADPPGVPIVLTIHARLEPARFTRTETVGSSKCTGHMFATVSLIFIGPLPCAALSSSDRRPVTPTGWSHDRDNFYGACEMWALSKP